MRRSSPSSRAGCTQLNPGAPFHVDLGGEIDPNEILNAGLYNPDTKTADVKRWLHEEAYEHGHGGHRHHGHGHDDHGHDHGHDQGTITATASRTRTTSTATTIASRRSA